MLTEDNILNNFTEIKEFFNKIDLKNSSTNSKKQICRVNYKTNNNELNFDEKMKVSILISSDKCKVCLIDLDSDKYHNEFSSDFQNFIFEEQINV